MYINFINSYTVYSFNDKEIIELENLFTLFKNYGKSDLEKIKSAISSKFVVVDLIPLFYNVKNEIKENIKIDMYDKYKKYLLKNDDLYIEYGLFIRDCILEQQRGIISLPDYLINELKNFNLEYTINRTYNLNAVNYIGPTTNLIYKLYGKPFINIDEAISHRREKYNINNNKPKISDEDFEKIISTII